MLNLSSWTTDAQFDTAIIAVFEIWFILNKDKFYVKFT
jgi:hypothetical protein